jgi:hypothetical protein
MTLACFRNRQTLAAGVRPSPGAATSVSWERMELWKTCSWRVWLWPRTATLRIVNNFFVIGPSLFVIFQR